MGRVLPLFHASCYSFCAVLSVRLCGFADCSASDTCLLPATFGASEERLEDKKKKENMPMEY